MEKELTKNYKQWLWLIPFIAFLFDLLLIINHLTTPLDHLIYQFLHTYQSTTLTTVFKGITFLGSGHCLIGISIIIFVIHHKKGAFLGIHLGMIHIVNSIIKSIIRRPRPDKIFHLVKETTYSFPSGHAMSSTIVYLIINEYLQKTQIPCKKIVYMMTYLIIFLICLSRVYLGVHYFSDVLGGFLFSFSYFLFIKYHHLLNPKQ